MEHPEDYKLRKRYEADRASGIAPGSMAQWMNDTAFKGLTTKLEAPRERIIAQALNTILITYQMCITLSTLYRKT